LWLGGRQSVADEEIRHFNWQFLLRRPNSLAYLEVGQKVQVFMEILTAWKEF